MTMLQLLLSLWQPTQQLMTNKPSLCSQTCTQITTCNSHLQYRVTKSSDVLQLLNYPICTRCPKKRTLFRTWRRASSSMPPPDDHDLWPFDPSSPLSQDEPILTAPFRNNLIYLLTYWRKFRENSSTHTADIVETKSRTDTRTNGRKTQKHNPSCTA